MLRYLHQRGHEGGSRPSPQVRYLTVQQNEMRVRFKKDKKRMSSSKHYHGVGSIINIMNGFDFEETIKTQTVWRESLPSMKLHCLFSPSTNDQFNVSCLHFSGYFQDSPCQYLYQGGVRGEESQDWNTSRW